MLCFSEDDGYIVVFEDGMVWRIDARVADAGRKYEQILLSPEGTPRSNPRELSNLQTVGKSSHHSAMAKVLSLLCIFLVTLVPLLHTSHVHPENSKLANHSCSICWIAHDGVLLQRVYQPIPVFAAAIFVGVGGGTPKSLLVTSSIYIRPPPSV